LQEQPASPVEAETHGNSVISTELKRNVLTVQNTVLRLAAKKARTPPVASRKYLQKTALLKLTVIIPIATVISIPFWLVHARMNVAMEIFATRVEAPKRVLM